MSELVTDMCRNLGMNDAYEQYRTMRIWSSVVGEAIAEVTAVERFTSGQLFVRVKSPAWRMELNFRKKDILRRINESLEKAMVKEIIFK
jgi:predicted nucleic acid-binding Zn ribbon protein